MSVDMAYPEFIGETEQAVILVVPALESELSVLFKRFHEGEEINYWFRWEIVSDINGDYIVMLEIGWDIGDIISIGFTLDMWEYLPVITRKSNLILMTDWRLIEEGIAAGIDDMGRFRPKALLVRDAGRGIEGLSNKAAEEARSSGRGNILSQLISILRQNYKSSRSLH